jgi:hypothetical protein
MFRGVGRSILYPFLAVARLVSRLTYTSLRAFEFSAFGLLCLLLPSSVSAGEVTLAWDPAEDPNVAGYKLYYGHEKGRYEGNVDVGLETAVTLTDLEDGQAYYFVLVAYDIDGNQGELSEEVAYDGPPTDVEGGAEAGGVTDSDEADQGESDGGPVLETADETAADELDMLPDLEQDAENDQEHKRAEARAQIEVIPHADLRIVSVDSETLVGEGAADLAIDGRAETFWQTARGPRASRHPHEVVIALGGEYIVRGFRYLPRQDGKTDGMVERYSFYVRQDGEDWGLRAVGGALRGQWQTMHQCGRNNNTGRALRPAAVPFTALFPLASCVSVKAVVGLA